MNKITETHFHRVYKKDRKHLQWKCLFLRIHSMRCSLIWRHLIHHPNNVGSRLLEKALGNAVGIFKNWKSRLRSWNIMALHGLKQRKCLDPCKPGLLCSWKQLFVLVVVNTSISPWGKKKDVAALKRPWIKVNATHTAVDFFPQDYMEACIWVLRCCTWQSPGAFSESFPKYP